MNRQARKVSPPATTMVTAMADHSKDAKATASHLPIPSRSPSSTNLPSLTANHPLSSTCRRPSPVVCVVHIHVAPLLRELLLPFSQSAFVHVLRLDDCLWPVIT